MERLRSLSGLVSDNLLLLRLLRRDLALGVVVVAVSPGEEETELGHLDRLVVVYVNKCTSSIFYNPLVLFYLG